jgi:hypothetical protein
MSEQDLWQGESSRVFCTAASEHAVVPMQDHLTAFVF